MAVMRDSTGLPTPTSPTPILPTYSPKGTFCLRKPPLAAYNYLRARVQNHYNGLFIALVSQLVPVAQRFSAVACSANVQGSIPAQYLLFLIFFPRTLKFFLTKSIVGTACRSSEGRRPCLGRPSRRSLARAEGPV